MFRGALSVPRRMSTLRRGAAPLVGRLGDASREAMEFDFLVVGGGPAGLSAAIRAKQAAPEANVCVVEKGAEVGAHILSGNVFQPTSLDELLPGWRDGENPVAHTPVKEDHFFFLTQNSSLEIPHALLPPQLHNEGNFVVSLGEVCRWLASEAENLGVEIYSGFSAAAPVVDDKGRVRGVQTADVGIAKDGGERASGAWRRLEAGMQLLGQQTLLAEGCRGSLSEDIMARYGLRDAVGACPQSYGLGIKEVWEVDPSVAAPGRVMHTVGYPLDMSTYGGGFLYHMEGNLVHLGLVVGLDYRNPYLSPYGEFQKWKSHPRVREILATGRPVSYGARCLNEGGSQALPKITFPGGMLAGCSAGFLNVPKIKDSWVWSEMEGVRNAKPSFKAGLLPGMAYTGASLWVFRGKEPWTFRWSGTDAEKTLPASKCEPIEYPKPDGEVTFDLLDALANANVNHEHDQPAHLKVKEGLEAFPEVTSHGLFGGPESRFCPARVYEYVPAEDAPQLVTLSINAQNCVHCKCCSIKTPNEFIRWTVPEGGGGPQYAAM